MDVATPTMLPFMLPPVIFNFEFRFDDCIKENLPALLKVICCNSRIVVKIFYSGMIRCSIFSSIWNIIGHMLVQVRPLNICRTACKKDMRGSSIWCSNLCNKIFLSTLPKWLRPCKFGTSIRDSFSKASSIS